MEVITVGSDREILLIDENGEKLGKKTLKEAVEYAKDKSLDLVQVNNADIAVCKIMNFEKQRYLKEKAQKKSHKKEQKVKEVKFSPNISDHDIKTKVRHIEDFLEHNHKVKLTVVIKVRRFDDEKKKILFEETMKKVFANIEHPYKIDGKASIGGSNCSVHIVSA